METTDTPVKQDTGKWNVFTAIRWNEQILTRANRMMSEKRYETMESWIEKAGHYALIASGFLGLFFALVGAIKWDQLSAFLIGIVWLPFVCVAQYAAFKFSPATREQIKSSASQLSSNSLLNCFALWHLLLGIIAFTGFLYIAIKADSFYLFGVGLVIFTICELVAWLCLNPSLLNIKFLPPATTGEEALGVFAFFFKIMLRLATIAFGVGVIAGAFGLLGAVIRLFRGDIDSVMGASSSAWMVLGFAYWPLIGYVFFVINHLMLDIFRAILSIPGKLDIIGKK